MGTKEAGLVPPRGDGAHSRASGTISTPHEPESSPEASWPQLRTERFDQMPLNYSGSQAGASSTRDSHYRYRKRDGPEGQKGEPIDTVTESGATTEASAYSYYSARDLSAFVKVVDGRFFNNQSDLYVMPSDDSEFERLGKQHYALVLGQGGLLPCEDIARSILSSRDGDRKRAILDLGCGSGIWAIEAARQFPDCDVVGLDLAPAPVDPELVPENCRFEIDDINLGLSHYHGYFDVIHVRCIGAGLSDHAKMMRDVEACLTPGGLVVFMDGDQTVYQEDMVTPIAVGQERNEGGDPAKGSWLHRIAREIRWAAVYNGCDIDGLEDCIDQGIWDHDLIDPSTVKVASLSTPIGTWAKARDLDTQQRVLYVGSLIRQDMMRANRSWHPMLRKYGIPQDTLNEWSKRIDDELTSETFRMCMRWRYTWGRRRTDSNASPSVPGTQSASQQPDTTSTTRKSGTYRHSRTGSSPSFRFMEVYHTKEEAAAAMARRRQKVKDLPLPMVTRIRLLSV